MIYFIIADGEVGNDEETNKPSSCILIHLIKATQGNEYHMRCEFAM